MTRAPGTPPRIYLSAGEPSGDAHAAAVARALRRRFPAVDLEAFGGPKLEGAGARVLDRMEGMSVVGFVEAIGKIPAHLALLRRVEAALRAARYDLVVLVDYPGYHLRVAQAAHRLGVPVLYYIAPQMWAWGTYRVPRLRAVNRLAVILPFEEQFFNERGVPAKFVGHPLRDRPPLPSRADARRDLGLDPARPVLGLFPGSRAIEVTRHWGAFREVAGLLRTGRPDLQVIAAGSPNGQYPDPGDILVHRGDPALVFAAADAGLCKSGTTTLEAALADLPMVITYRLNPLSYWIARRLTKVEWAGLVNLVAGREVCPELLQQHGTPRALADALRPLLDRASPEARAQRAALALVRDKLGAPGAADRVAALAAELLG